MINIGIYGATGYAGFEAVRILHHHPKVNISFITSETYTGQTYNQVYPVSWPYTLVSSAKASLEQVQAVFCCLPHAASMPTVLKAREAGVRVIDLSADFRLKNIDTYQHWYKVQHTAPHLLPQAVYGLAEVNYDQIKTADLIAVPGCYPTSILLPLYPLLKQNLLHPQMPIIADSKSGISGAGRKLSLKTHFVEANENLSPYSIGQTHRHLAEINQTITQWRNLEIPLIFSPHLVPINRGMLSTIYLSLNQDITPSYVQTLFEETYNTAPFIRILPPGQLATFAHTQRTNQCAISITVVNPRQLILCSSIDNLGKGAAGQAVQNFNIMFNLPQTLGF